MRLEELGEINLIKRIASRLPRGNSVLKGIGDDAAVIKWKRDKHLLFTSDMLVEGVHFKRNSATPFQIGWKALGRNISDIAAMGGIPKHAVISIGLNPNTSLSFVEGIYKGITTLAKKFKMSIVGGDTTRSDKLVIDIALLGEVEKKCVTMRDAAKTGDCIFVTGFIGGSMNGKHLSFMPRVEESRKLVKNFKVNSMIDISDGLILDLWRILDASNVGARIYENLIPISREAKSFDLAIREGEDFELLFTMSAKEARRLMGSGYKGIKAPVSLIGEIMPRVYGYKMRRASGKEVVLGRSGYTHF